MKSESHEENTSNQRPNARHVGTDLPPFTDDSIYQYRYGSGSGNVDNM